MSYVPALDGLRAVAVLAVIAYHAGWLPGGFLGVDIFFALSGFLITSLLVTERDRHGSVSLKSFYARRALRLLPALVPVLVVVGAIMLVREPTWRTTGYLFGVASYLGNYVIAWHGYGSPLDHFWSLAVEEQFYVLWPAALLLLLRVHRSRLRVPIVALVSVAVIARLTGLVPPVVAHPLMIGCAMALVPLRLPSSLLNALSVGGTVMLIGLFGWSRLDYLHSPASLLAALAVVPVLLGAPWSSRALSLPPLGWIGRRSYGLYLWHAPLLAFVPMKVAAVIATFVIAALSYRVIEAPALAFKDRLPRWTPRAFDIRHLVPVGVAVATALVYLPTLRFGWITTYDDAAMLLWNSNLLGWDPRWALSSLAFGHWMPLTWWTWMVDAHLWGLWAGGWHAGNVVLHAISAGLVYLVACRLLGSQLGAAFAALVWALHPLRIESVAWISERKDCLSGVFVLGALWAYLRAVDRRRFPWLALALFALACASKSIAVVVVPFIVLLDWAVLHRRAWREKVPFVLVAVATSAVAFVGIAVKIHNLLPWDKVGLGPRLLHVAYSTVFYLKQTVWPSRMSHMIEYTWPASWEQWEYPASVAIVLLAVTALVLLRSRVVTAAALAYAVAVFPQAGLFQNGPQLVANRYSYLAALPVALLLGAGLTMAWRRFPRSSALSQTACVGGLIAVTSVSLPIWTNDDTLQTYAANSEPTCLGCQQWGAVVAVRRGDPVAARRYLERGLAIPRIPAWLRHEQLWGYGAVLEYLGETERAKAAVREYLAGQPEIVRDYAYEQTHMQDARARLARLEARP